ncbi:MAG: hypothetical protein ACP5OC_01680 [Thermoplasmata archaeon]
MRRFLVALHTMLDEDMVQHFSQKMASSGYNVTYVEEENVRAEELEKMLEQFPDCIILTSGPSVSAALIASVRSRPSGAIIAINPMWKEDLKPLLSSVESSVIIFTDGPDLSSIRMQAMKYHDRIAGSRIHYLKSDAMKTLLGHPERMIKVLEDALDA